MNIETLTEGPEDIEAEAISPDELLLNLLQDLAAGNPPDDLAAEFVEEFVVRDRPEAAQILQMFETPSETIVDILKGVIGQSYQIQMEALEQRGKAFIDGLKTAISQEMTNLAAETS